jgi:hypothetical protein
LALRSGAGSALIDASKKIEWSDERWNARPTCDAEEQAFDATMTP